MKIKYLKDTHDSKVGDVKEIQDVQASVLVKLGLAEIFTEPKKAAPRKPKNEQAHQDE